MSQPGQRTSFQTPRYRLRCSHVATRRFRGAEGFTEGNEESRELNSRQEMMKNTGVTGIDRLEGDDTLAHF
jgi:hypothetical protein